MFVLALVLRLAVYLQSRGLAQMETPILDSRYYLEAGRAIASGAGLPPQPYFMNPGYIWFVAVSSWLFHEPQRPLVVTQIVLDALTCVLAALLAARLFGRLAGLATGFLLAVYGYGILSATRVLPETVAAFLLVVLALMLFRAEDKPRPFMLLFTGVVFGLLTLFRSNALLILPFLGIALWPAKGAARWRTAAMRFSLCLVGAAVVILPVTLHNALSGDDRVLISSSGGVNFYLGNAAGSDGRFVSLNLLPLAPGRFDDDLSGGRFERSVQVYVEEREGRRLKPSEVSAFWMHLARTEITRHPTAWVALLWRKTYLFFNAFEIPQIDNLYFLAHYLPILGPLAFTSRILWPLGLFGFLLLLRHPGRARPLFLLFTGYALSIILFFVSARHRLLAAPLIASFAGYGLLRLYDLVRTRPEAGLREGSLRQRWLVPALLFIACLIVTNLNPALGQRVPSGVARGERGSGLFRPGAEYLDFASQHNNLAALLLERGDAVNAERECRQGLVQKPQHPTLLFNLGRALETQGDFSGAREALEQSLRINPGNAEVAAHLGDMRYKTGDFAGARAALEQAIHLAPLSASAWNSLGPVKYELGDPEGALAALREAERLAPGWTQPNYNRGLVLSRLGRYGEAIAVLESLYRQGPSNRTFAFALAGAYKGAQRLGAAESLLEQLLAQDPNDTGSLLLLAEIQLTRGETAQARTFLFRVLAANPRNARALELLRASGSKGKGWVNK